MSWFTFFALVCCLSAVYVESSAVNRPMVREVRFDRNGKRMEALEPVLQKAFKRLGAATGLELLGDSEGDANLFVDLLLRNVREVITEENLDPFDLPDEVTSFSDKGWLITWHGEASLTDGYCEGISTIERTGDATIDFSDGENLLISAEVGVDDLTISYKCSASFMGIGPSITVTANADHPSMMLGIGIDVDTLFLTLNTFSLEDVGYVSVRVRGALILDWILDCLTDWILNLFKGPILDDINDDLVGALDDVIDNINDQIQALFGTNTEQIAHHKEVQKAANKMSSQIEYRGPTKFAVNRNGALVKIQ